MKLPLQLPLIVGAFLAGPFLTIGLADENLPCEGPPVPTEGGLLFVAFDIRPGACPNYFNNILGRPAQILTAAIVGDDDVQAANVQQSSLLLTLPGGGGEPRGGGCNQIPPLETYVADVTVPIVAPVDCECSTDGPDGGQDLVVRFDADEIAAALQTYEPGEEVVLWINGQLLDGTPIIGYDCVEISGTVAVGEPTWGSTKALYR